MYEKLRLVDTDLHGAEAIFHVTHAPLQWVQHMVGLQCRSAGFHEFFVTGHIPTFLAISQDASHFQEGYMANLWSSTQLIEQVLLYTLR